jgi:delta24-sterol reductase
MELYTLDTHDSAVRELARKVSHFHANQIPFRINHGSTNSTRVRDPATPQLAIAHLDNILDVDEENSFALVEPNVPLDKLSFVTLGKGLMLPVVMEFPGKFMLRSSLHGC